MVTFETSAADGAGFSLLVGLAVGFAAGQWVVILSLKAALRNQRPLSPLVGVRCFNSDAGEYKAWMRGTAQASCKEPGTSNAGIAGTGGA